MKLQTKLDGQNNKVCDYCYKIKTNRFYYDIYFKCYYAFCKNCDNNEHYFKVLNKVSKEEYIIAYKTQILI